jgi:hypothetical protein
MRKKCGKLIIVADASSDSISEPVEDSFSLGLAARRAWGIISKNETRKCR